MEKITVKRLYRINRGLRLSRINKVKINDPITLKERMIETREFSFSRGDPSGIVVLETEDGNNFKLGWSFTHRKDKYNPKIANTIVNNRLESSILYDINAPFHEILRVIGNTHNSALRLNGDDVESGMPRDLEETFNYALDDLRHKVKLYQERNSKPSVTITKKDNVVTVKSKTPKAKTTQKAKKSKVKS